MLFLAAILIGACRVAAQMAQPLQKITINYPTRRQARCGRSTSQKRADITKSTGWT